MLQSITITAEDILKQVKLSLQIPDLIQSIVSHRIITDAATEAGITVDNEELQEAADTIRLFQKLHSAQETFGWLEKHHLSIDDLEEIAYFTTISQKLMTYLFANKVEPYFYENQLNYAGVVMHEVVFQDEDLAMELFYSIQEQEISFYDVAHKYIKDKELRRKGGYRGILSRKDLKSEISAAVFGTTPPETLKPILTSNGIHLILVEEIIQAELNDQLRYQIGSDLFVEWVINQRNKMKVTYS
ncbi:peptidylprolyl isomerase [Cylindrospermopsis raciborskii]|uniref:peptidylprolyl isomerase n=1 Tax=Cylindrospermopsis raciborskii CENA302 TaxID=1170768 RepID=A0A9Q5WAL8_9CYAN|nr:peptidylprolyl isomerase [Cylindrospermopsis raciborskii]OPH10513.1 peptidylprolyl isomerase [Cylindrospermopsis raciborskii CENA302]